MQDQSHIKKIIHIDMDAFFASVEQLDQPELRGKPVAVGGNGERGVIAAASYEARAFGVRSAMPGLIARRKCPHLIFVKPRFDRYKEISLHIRQIFYEYSDLVEPLSLDEAFIDVTENKKEISSASRIARLIREQIYEEVGLRASAGISVNKFTAKIASDINKPNGQKTINPEEVIPFLEELNIEKFFGIGKVTAEKMNTLGIFKGKHLKDQRLEFLVRNFGKSGKHFYEIVRGIQYSEVKPNRLRKSIAAERTFSSDIQELSLLLEKLEWIAEELEQRMQRAKVKGKGITLKIKYQDFSIHTRSRTLLKDIHQRQEFYPIIRDLLEQEKILKPVRLLGISISKLNNEPQLHPVGLQLEIDFPNF